MEGRFQLEKAEKGEMKRWIPWIFKGKGLIHRMLCKFAKIIDCI